MKSPFCPGSFFKEINWVSFQGALSINSPYQSAVRMRWWCCLSGCSMTSLRLRWWRSAPWVMFGQGLITVTHTVRAKAILLFERFVSVCLWVNQWISSNQPLFVPSLFSPQQHFRLMLHHVFIPPKEKKISSVLYLGKTWGKIDAVQPATFLKFLPHRTKSIS